jgi:hypothetical protein
MSEVYDITVNRRETEGFGFVIISSVTKSGSVIGEFIGMCHLRQGKNPIELLVVQ